MNEEELYDPQGWVFTGRISGLGAYVREVFDSTWVNIWMALHHSKEWQAWWSGSGKADLHVFAYFEFPDADPRITRVGVNGKPLRKVIRLKDSVRVHYEMDVRKQLNSDPSYSRKLALDETVDILEFVRTKLSLPPLPPLPEIQALPPGSANEFAFPSGCNSANLDDQRYRTPGD